MHKAEEAERGRHSKEQQRRWKRDFTKILSIQRQFSLDELSAVRQRPIRTKMDESPLLEELYCAVDRIGNGRLLVNQAYCLRW